MWTAVRTVTKAYVAKARLLDFFARKKSER